MERREKKKGNLKGLKEGKNGPLERQGEKRKNQVEGKKGKGGELVLGRGWIPEKNIRKKRKEKSNWRIG